MSEFRRLGQDRITGYEVCVLGVSKLDEIASLRMPSERFICLLGMDARPMSVDTISRAAENLLNEGAAYICCWGPGCERVHDLIDEVVVGNGVTPIAWANVVTTWHENDSLKDVVEFFLWSAAPDNMYTGKCSSAVAIRVGNEFDIVEMEINVAAALKNPPSNPPLQRSAVKRPPI